MSFTTEKPLIVPGIEITKGKNDEKSIYYNVLKRENELQLNLNLKSDEDPKLELETLIPSTTFAFHKVNAHLKVKSFCFVRKNREVTPFSFNLTYQIVYNATGKYQLNIHIIFEPNKIPLELSGNIYNHFEFDIVFPKASIIIGTNTVDFNKIDTVKVFLVRTNPKTSRGTVTTVQRPG